MRERQYWSERMIDFLGMMAKIKVPSRRILAIPRPSSLLRFLVIPLAIGLVIYLTQRVKLAGASTTSQHSALAHNLAQKLIFATSLLALTFVVIIGALAIVLRRRTLRRRTFSVLEMQRITIEISRNSKVGLLPEESLPTGETYIIKTRANILREILNVSSPVRELSHQLESDKSVEMEAGHSLSDIIFNGIPPRESRCLLAARSLRRNSAVPSTQDPSDLKPDTPASGSTTRQKADP